ncbi:MAG: right-handed parallel beta-helix repeat-containing protein [Candidatus Jordarchaeaceae archaeon]
MLLLSLPLYASDLLDNLAEGEIIIVNSDGNFSTIQEAINAAKDGDTIIVKEGVYAERLYINKSISLIGEGADKTILDAEAQGTAIRILSNNVTISGFRIINGVLPAGIQIINASCVRIENNTITQCNNAVYAENTNNSDICFNNITFNYYHAVMLSGSKFNRIVGNILTEGTPCGILLYKSEDNLIANNSISNFCQGITLQLSTNNSIEGNYVSRNGPYGIHFENAEKNNLTDNVVTENEYGIYLEYSSENLADGNIISGQSALGMYLLRSANNKLRNNNFTMNGVFGNFGVNGDSVDHFVNYVDTSNLVNGKPIYYFVEQNGTRIYGPAGFVAIVLSRDIKCENLVLEPNYQGLMLVSSINITVSNVTISNCPFGIHLVNVENSLFKYNTVEKSIYDGIYLINSSSNKFFHNNFVNNWNQVLCEGICENIWDNGYPSGGNYWSDYNEVDEKSGLNQDQFGSDGIKDKAYCINADNVDRYPLTGRITSFIFEVENVTASFILHSNATSATMHFDPKFGPLLQLNLTTQNSEFFCRIAIPKNILSADPKDWIVKVDGNCISYIIVEDEENAYLYFASTCGAGCEIVVIGENVIAEFNMVNLGIFLALSFLLIACWRETNHHKVDQLSYAQA